MKKAVKLIISGTVQGVFFRNFIKENALKFGLRGHVRNLEDGDVETVLEGDGDDIEKMVEVCREGPPHSQIRNIKVEERKYSGDFKDFKIIRF